VTARPPYEPAEAYPDCLRDESRRTGRAESISFPVTEADVIRQLQEAARQGRAVTVQGARTGITGGAVPDGGHILNLSKMDRVGGLHRTADGGGFAITTQPGVLLSELRRRIEKKDFDTAGWSAGAVDALEAFRASGDWFFSPDPTETSASIGGMAACNASGALSFAYGAMRRHITRIRVVLVDGDVLELARPEPRAAGRAFTLTTAAGRAISGTLPGYAMPAVKSAAGYYAQDDMALLDLFIGAEGTLGVITELDLLLLPAPGVRWGVMSFLPDSAAAVTFVEALRAAPERPVAMEYFNGDALRLLRTQKEQNAAFGELPAVPEEWNAAVYLEYHGADEEAVEAQVAAMAELLEAQGGDMEATWLAAEARDMVRLKNFRHALPEAVNMLIDRRRQQEPKLTKLGTDLAVGDAYLRETDGDVRAGPGPRRTWSR
jgi:D-lactate dehydrogenase (cytochrome)